MLQRGNKISFSYSSQPVPAGVLHLFRKERRMAQDTFKSSIDSIIAPAANCFAIVPSDTLDLPFVTKAIYVGEAGNIALRSLAAAASVTFVNVQPGSILDVRAKQVLATGTTANSLIGLA
jgi:hypothetical protein